MWSYSAVSLHSLENIGPKHGCQVECRHAVEVLLLFHLGKEIAQVAQDAVVNVWHPQQELTHILTETILTGFY